MWRATILAFAALAIALVAAGCNDGAAGDGDALPPRQLVRITSTPAPPTATAGPTNTPRPTSTPRSTSTPRPTNTPRPTRPPLYKLAVISANCVWPVAGSFVECEGFVENLTSQTMENIQAVIVYTDAAGTPLASDTALIDYNPMFPGQQSPWSVIGTYNPRYERWRVEFKEFFGGTILTNYDAIR